MVHSPEWPNISESRCSRDDKPPVSFRLRWATRSSFASTIATNTCSLPDAWATAFSSGQPYDGCVEASRSRLRLHVLLGAPFYLVVGLAGYAWSQWNGVALFVCSGLALSVVISLNSEVRTRDKGPAASTFPLALVIAVFGYFMFGVFGFVFMGGLSWIALSLGNRSGRRALEREDMAREARLSHTRQTRI